jgi:hypothetical protein
MNNILRITTLFNDYEEGIMPKDLLTINKTPQKMVCLYLPAFFSKKIRKKINGKPVNYCFHINKNKLFPVFLVFKEVV